MPPYFDSPEDFYHRYSNRYVEKRLIALRSHYNDLSWLSKEADDLYHVIRTGLLVPFLFHRSIEALFAIAPYMLRRDDFRRWSKLLIEALAVANNFHDDTLRGRIFTLIGQGDVLDGAVKPARSALETARDIASAQSDNDALLMAYIGLFKTETYQPTNNFSPALVAQVRGVACQVGDPRLDGWLNQALAALYAHRGETQTALGYGMTALAYWKQRGNPLEIVKSLLGLLTACQQAELTGYAQRLLEEAYKHLPAAHSDQLYALVAYQAGTTYHLRGEYRAALERLKQAHDGFQKLEWKHHIGTSEHALGLVYIELGEYHEARARLLQAAQTWEQLGAAHEYASAQHALGYLEAKRGSLAMGLALLRHARELCRRIPRMNARTLLEGYIDEDIATFERLRGADD